MDNLHELAYREDEINLPLPDWCLWLSTMDSYLTFFFLFGFSTISRRFGLLNLPRKEINKDMNSGEKI